MDDLIIIETEDTVIVSEVTETLYIIAGGDQGLMGPSAFIYEPLTGTVNGTTGSDGNDTFTLTSPKSTFLILINQIPMHDGINYDYSVVSGIGTIIFRAGYIPITGDIPTALYDHV